MSRTWSKEDDQWLYALWMCSRHKVETVASVLGRTCSSVTQRASVKGWKRVLKTVEIG